MARADVTTTLALAGDTMLGRGVADALTRDRATPLVAPRFAARRPRPAHPAGARADARRRFHPPPCSARASRSARRSRPARAMSKSAVSREFVARTRGRPAGCSPTRATGITRPSSTTMSTPPNRAAPSATSSRPCRGPAGDGRWSQRGVWRAYSRSSFWGDGRSSSPLGLAPAGEVAIVYARLGRFASSTSAWCS